jgi:hypothetical protein
MSDEEKTPSLANKLKDLGYVGVTGDTPYKLPTPDQLSELRRIYDDKSLTNAPRVVQSTDINLNVNFDGTHNNGLYPAKGESPTNIHELSKLQRLAQGANPDNTIYMPGVGAQTLPTGTIDPKTGRVADEASPSLWKALPIPAGNEAKAILEKAYDQLKERINATLADNPKASIYINLTGFSRGAAQAVAFANMLNERGIGPFKAGDVRIANMLLLDPVDKSAGALNTKPPTHVTNTLAIVATAESRNIMDAMAVGKDARVFGLPVVHSGLGGSYNPQGTAAVVLQKGKEFLSNGGVPMADIPSNLKPDWTQMYIHNSSVDNRGIPKLGADSDNWEFNRPARYYEGQRWQSPSVQESLEKLQNRVKSLSEFQALNRTPENKWSEDGKQLQLFNQKDGTSKLYTLNSDGIPVREQHLDVNGVDVTPKPFQTNSVQMNMEQGQSNQPQIKLSM